MKNVILKHTQIQHNTHTQHIYNMHVVLHSKHASQISFRDDYDVTDDSNATEMHIAWLKLIATTSAQRLISPHTGSHISKMHIALRWLNVTTDAQGLISPNAGLCISKIHSDWW